MKCKCSKLKKTIVLFDNNTLPDELRERIDSCPECREFFEHSNEIRRILALKGHESPRPGHAERCVVRVRQRLEALSGENEACRDWRAVLLGPMPVLRFGMAALLLSLMGLYMLSSNPEPLHQWTPQAQPQSQPVIERPDASPSIEMEAGADIILQEEEDYMSASNGQPGEIQHSAPSPFRLINIEP